jgi:hypothetical protein
VIEWVGNPTCQEAHAAFLKWLKKNIRVFVQPSKNLHTSVFGNLGESISLFIGKQEMPAMECFEVNATTPFKGISAPEIDLCWIHFDTDPLMDHVVFQEVKATAAVRLTYADSLLKDYGKLFGLNQQVTAAARINAIRAKLHMCQNRPAFADRLDSIVGVSPQSSPRVHLLPTLIYDRKATGSVAKMNLIRTALASRGWANVSAWTVGMYELKKRFDRLARGLP